MRLLKKKGPVSISREVEGTPEERVLKQSIEMEGNAEIGIGRDPEDRFCRR